MARPRQHAPEALHAQVMAACDEWLNTQPAHSLSLRALAREIGCAPSTLLKLYGSFNNLLQYVNVETLKALSEGIELSASAAPQERLGALAHAYWHFASKHPHRWQLLFEYPLAQEGELDQRQSQAIEALFVRVEATLCELRPGLNEADANRLARTLWGSVHGLVQLGMTQRLGYSQGRPVEVTDLLDQLLAMTLAALGARSLSP
ncbi:TetR/AcrR family transcriptional regulator [Halotalea alkalilenta]|uniref:TetR family transcriptional regulator n=1 Tax=Halotalea alkalilenta TaxID=376489 RepID=A0A172YJA1_9GAMM|nr:TetR-like C-terminal domain-containing protein [Halotalea alkalilenta]ANF59274.1 TetR family transcriptional regulator [Halotalea alkalilenta]